MGRREVKVIPLRLKTRLNAPLPALKSNFLAAASFLLGVLSSVATEKSLDKLERSPSLGRSPDE